MANVNMTPAAGASNYPDLEKPVAFYEKIRRINMADAYAKKGSNLAATDVKYLFNGIREFYADKSEAGIDRYSELALKRIWRAERFSWWFTQLMHRFPDDGAIVAKFQEAEIDYLLNSESGSRTIAENYVGLPLDFGQT